MSGAGSAAGQQAVPAVVVPADEEKSKLEGRNFGRDGSTQWNCALWDDSCLYIVPRSHRRIRTAAEVEVSKLLWDAQRRGCVHIEGEMAVPLKAGQASLHSDMLLHSSDANSSSRRRCGVALTYHTPDVRFNVVGDHSPEDFYGFVCRGHDSSGYWPEDVAPPEGDFVPRRDAEKGLLDPLVDRSKL